MEALTSSTRIAVTGSRPPQMMVRAESYTPRRGRQGAPAVRRREHLPVQAPRRTIRPSSSTPRRSRSIPSTSRRPPARRPVLRGRPVEGAVAGDRHALPQGRSAARRSARAPRAATTAPRGARTSSASIQKALGYYKIAYDIDSTYLPTLLGRADLLFKHAGLGQRRQDLHRPSSSSTARQDEATSSASTTASGWSVKAARPAQEGAQDVREGARDRSAPPRRRCWR